MTYSSGALMTMTNLAATADNDDDDGDDDRYRLSDDDYADTAIPVWDTFKRIS